MIARLCKDCAWFIHNNSQCGRAYKEPDYVYGRTASTYSAQAERASHLDADCGPGAKHFKIIPVLEYSETVVSRAYKAGM